MHCFTWHPSSINTKFPKPNNPAVSDPNNPYDYEEMWDRDVLVSETRHTFQRLKGNLHQTSDVRLTEVHEALWGHRQYHLGVGVWGSGHSCKDGSGHSWHVRIGGGREGGGTSQIILPACGAIHETSSVFPLFVKRDQYISTLVIYSRANSVLSWTLQHKIARRFAWQLRPHTGL